MLKITEFGDPLLRGVAAPLSESEIIASETQQLITDMRDLLHYKKLGVGLAAPQVGVGKALAIISIRPSKHRPKVKPFDRVIINPEIIETFGNRKQMYEGCISGGAGKAGLFASVPRHKKLILKYYDETGVLKQESFEGLVAHVVQHEVDHLKGVLFVDRVTDTKSYMTYSEYLKFTREKAKKSHTKVQHAARP